MDNAVAEQCPVSVPFRSGTIECCLPAGHTGLHETATGREKCTYCQEWYPKPCELYHTDEECDLNVNEHSASAAPTELDLAPIEARRAKVTTSDLFDLITDYDALIAEVKRLRQGVARAKQLRERWYLRQRDKNDPDQVSAHACVIVADEILKGFE